MRHSLKTSYALCMILALWLFPTHAVAHQTGYNAILSCPPPPPVAPVPPSGSPPPPPPDCKSAAGTATVNPGNFRSAVAGLGAGQTIVLAPGTYPSLSMSGKNFGGAKIQCAQPGQCKFSNSHLNGVSGLTIEGIFIRGGNIALEMENTTNMVVRCSTFMEMDGTGLLIEESKGTFRAENNTFFNSKLGCSSISNECYYKSDGSPLPYTDYGIRVHGADNLQIQGNQFTGVGGNGIFNHAISLKERVKNTFIIGNTFGDCGRNCVEPGQQESNVHDGDISSGAVTITGNTFNNVRRTATVLLVKNIHRVVFQGNTFNNVKGRMINLYFFDKGTRGYPPITNATIIKGVPRDRTVVGNGR